MKQPKTARPICVKKQSELSETARLIRVKRWRIKRSPEVWEELLKFDEFQEAVIEPLARSREHSAFSNNPAEVMLWLRLKGGKEMRDRLLAYFGAEGGYDEEVLKRGLGRMGLEISNVSPEWRRIISEALKLDFNCGAFLEEFCVLGS